MSIASIGAVAGVLVAGSLATSRAAPVLRNTAPNVGYTGSKVCSGCHREIYMRYSRTAMGRSITRPRNDLPQDGVRIRDEKSDQDFRVYLANGDLYQSQSQSSDGKPVFEHAYKLEYAIGSGENGISFGVRRGNYLFQAPLSYYAKTRSWALSPGFEGTGEGFSRPLHEACIVCHAGRAQAAPRRDGLYREPPFAEMAIGCENCHGPGQLHVAERARGLRPLPDSSIVNPARLPARLAEDICLRCHQGGDARILLPGKEYSDFRPGLPLVRTLAIIGLPLADKDADLLEHHSSMKASRCFQSTNGALSCLTCHDPHDQPGAREAPGYFRKKCLGCHSERRCRVSPAGDCVGCHMPKRSVEMISHSALTNHRIPLRPGAGVPLAAPEPARSDLPGLVLINGSEGEPPLPLVTRLAAYGELLNRSPEFQPRYLELLQEARRAVPEDPLVLAAWGRMALAENQPEAVPLLLKAEEKGTPGAATYIDLGEALARAGRAAESVAALERGEGVFPYSKAIRKHLILAYIRQKTYPKAKLGLERYVKDFPEDSFMRKLLSQVSEGSTP